MLFASFVVNSRAFISERDFISEIFGVTFTFVTVFNFIIGANVGDKIEGAANRITAVCWAIPGGLVLSACPVTMPLTLLYWASSWLLSA